MAKGRVSDDLENPDLCKRCACDTVIGTESADLPLRPAVSEPRGEAGEMTATDHRAKTKKKALARQASFGDAQVFVLRLSGMLRILRHQK